MEEINTQVAELTVLFKHFQEKPNKQTSISLRKALMKLKNTSHSLRKNVLLSMKPKPVVSVAPVVDPVAPEATIEPVTPVEPLEPPVKKVKRSKSKKEKQKITKEKATTVKFN